MRNPQAPTHPSRAADAQPSSRAMPGAKWTGQPKALSMRSV
jgi:hypothetical protein